jgi:hypothetical protein
VPGDHAHGDLAPRRGDTIRGQVPAEIWIEVEQRGDPALIG